MTDTTKRIKGLLDSYDADENKERLLIIAGEKKNREVNKDGQCNQSSERDDN